MKNLFLVVASVSYKYASLIKLICLIALAFLVEFFLRKDFIFGGIGVSEFIAFLAVFLFFLPLDKKFYASTSRILLVVYTACCIVFSLYTKDFSFYALSGIIIMSIAHRHSSPSLATMWVFPLIGFFISFIFEFFVGVIFRLNNFQAKTPTFNLSKLFLYFILPAFLSLVFLSIFACGYEEFEIVVDNIFSFIWNVLVNIFEINIAILFLIFLFLFALYETRLSAKFLVSKDISFELNEVLEKSFIICLLCFNLIFLSVNLVNLKDFIFQDNQYNLARDAISACDAMSLASLLAGFCTLVFFLAKNQNRTLRRLIIAWLLQNLIIIFTALVKLSIYIAEFSLTMSRIDGLFFMFFLAICTILALSKMYSYMTVKALNNYIVYAALGLSFVYISADKEDFIAKYNLSSSENPDFNYLKTLSPYSLVAIYEYKQAGNDVPMNLQKEIDLGLDKLKLNTLRNKILKTKLIAIQKNLD